MDLRAYLLQAQRKRRREGVLLSLLSGVFVILGALILILGRSWLGLIAIAFFAACGLVGIAQWRRPDRELPQAVGIVGSLLMGLAGVLMVIGHIAGLEFLGYRQPLALPVGLLCAGFFGIGGIVLLVRAARRPR